MYPKGQKVTGNFLQKFSVKFSDADICFWLTECSRYAILNTGMRKEDSCDGNGYVLLRHRAIDATHRLRLWDGTESCKHSNAHRPQVTVTGLCAFFL